MPRLAPRAPDYEKVLSKPKDVFGSETSADSLRLSPAVSFEAMTKQIDDYYDQWRSAWTGDFKNARSVSERLEEEAKRNPQSIVGLVGPALGRLVGIYYAALASRNGAQVVLELHAYRATNGKWPQTLEEDSPRASPGRGSIRFRAGRSSTVKGRAAVVVLSRRERRRQRRRGVPNRRPAGQRPNGRLHPLAPVRGGDHWQNNRDGCPRS